MSHLQLLYPKVRSSLSLDRKLHREEKLLLVYDLRFRQITFRELSFRNLSCLCNFDDNLSRQNRREDILVYNPELRHFGDFGTGHFGVFYFLVGIIFLSYFSDREQPDHS